MSNKCVNCGELIDEEQYLKFNKLCPTCKRMSSPNKGSKNLSNVLEIQTLEKKKENLGILVFLALAVPSGPLFMSFAAGLIPVGILIIFAQILMLYAIIKKYGKLNQEIRQLKNSI